MRTLPCLVLLVFLGACGGGGGGGGDDEPPDDARRMDAAIDITELSGDFTCAGTAWPATAPDPLSVTGRVTDPVGMMNVGGAAVELRKTTDDSLIVTGTAATNGIFAFNVTTAGAAIPLYRKATLSGHLDGYTYDPYAPFDGNHSGRGIYAPTAANRATYYAAAGVTPDPTKATVLVEIFDCIDLQVYGATVEAPTAGKVIYFDDSGVPSGSATATGSPGIAMLLNVPPGPIDITVHAGSVVYRAVPITSRANAFIYTPRLP
ncbi:MAG: hypothetical protein H0T46_09620 [Deltaproteobacteria bacterium]|nr:hypothetical protein [Deltaproteobacteria bacterium]